MSFRDRVKRLRGEDRDATTIPSAGAPPDLLRDGLFDREWYSLQRDREFPDDRAALDDYLLSGRVAGLSPHPLFEPAWYRPKDWRTAAEDPLLTYAREGGDPHPLFEAAGRSDQAAREIRERLFAATRLWVEQARSLRSATAQRPAASETAALVAWADTVALPDEDPLVSVVLPVLDRATHVIAAIASVRQQTFPGWELLVVDGGSTDATPQVLDRLAGADARIRVLTTEAENSSIARNAGTEAARGRYVAFLDSDDVWSPEHLQVALATLAAKQCTAVQALSRHWFRRISFRRDGLSALVVERAALQAVGGFDVALPWFAVPDLGRKLTASTALEPVAFVASTNYQDPSLTDPLKSAEKARWADVVTERQEIDWPALAAGADERPYDVSVLVPDILGWKATMTAVRSALESIPKVQVVVAHGGGSRYDWTMLTAHHDAGVRLLRTSVPRGAAFLTNFAFAHSAGRNVVVLPSGGTLVDGLRPGTGAGLPGVMLSARAFAEARGIDVIGSRPDATAGATRVEVKLSPRAQAAYAPSVEGGANG